MNEEPNSRNLLLVGAGGIGTQLTELLVPALRRINLQGTITLMDADVVEATNLGHQRYTQEDIGEAKVGAIAKRLDDESSPLRVKAIVENLRTAEQLEGYDFVVVCVDRPEPRRLVHQLSVPWLDLRCSGDGHVALSSQSLPALVERMTPDHEPASCQGRVRSTLSTSNTALPQPLHLGPSGRHNTGAAGLRPSNPWAA